MKTYIAALLAGAALLCAQASRTAEVEAAYAKLKEAEGKKDADGVREWAEKTSAAARAVVASPKPEKADEVEGWTNAVDYARQVDIYTEYSEYATAIGGVAPEKVIALVESIEKRNPKSEYLSKAYPAYMATLSQTGKSDQLMAAAVRRIEVDPKNPDLLLVLADGYMKQKEVDKATDAATKLIAVMPTAARPEGMSEADWEKKKTTVVGTAQWIAGVNYAEAKRYKEADEALRVALPVVRGQAGMEPATLFYLGVANYNLGKPTKNRALITEAIKFSEECAKLASPYRDLAQKNARQIRVEFGVKK
ncbi:hypothetical protein F183_A44720 [Bryobacterales bacterium F-183]|nr:hypothetical protein F183_A44720 [Bryobacterales bacterium F-183]